MGMIVDLPRTVVIALAHTLKHLAAFSLMDSFADASVFSKFADRTHMLLNSNTLTNLSAFSQLSPKAPVLTSFSLKRDLYEPNGFFYPGFAFVDIGQDDHSIWCAITPKMDWQAFDRQIVSIVSYISSAFAIAFIAFSNNGSMQCKKY